MGIEINQLPDGLWNVRNGSRSQSGQHLCGCPHYNIRVSMYHADGNVIKKGHVNSDWQRRFTCLWHVNIYIYIMNLL